MTEIEEEIGVLHAQMPRRSDLIEDLEDEVYVLKDVEDQRENEREQQRARRFIDLYMAYSFDELDGISAARLLHQDHLREDAAEAERLERERAQQREEEEARIRDETAQWERIQRFLLGQPEPRPTRRDQDRGPGSRTFDRLNGRLRRALNEGDRNEVTLLRDEIAAFTGTMAEATQVWADEQQAQRDREEDDWEDRQHNRQAYRGDGEAYSDDDAYSDDGQALSPLRERGDGYNPDDYWEDEFINHDQLSDHGNTPSELAAEESWGDEEQGGVHGYGQDLPDTNTATAEEEDNNDTWSQGTQEAQPVSAEQLIEANRLWGERPRMEQESESSDDDTSDS